MTRSRNDPGGYAALLADGGFQAVLWTQFLAAFNDNVYKMIVSVGAVELAANQQLGSRYLALAGAVFVLPFLLFAGYAGQLSDRFSKTRVLQITKAFEIVIMGFGMLALYARSIEMLLVVLFLLALQANFFSPAKYGILPEMLSEAQLTCANGLVELTTFAAIVLGTSVGSILFARWKGEPLVMGGTLLAIAAVGSLTSLFIRKVPASGSTLALRGNPLAEVWAGTQRIWRERSLRLTVAGISYFWFIGALFQMTIILLGIESLHLSDTQTGFLVTALAVGIGVGSLAAGWLSGGHIEVGLVPCGAALLGLCSIGVGCVHTFAPALVWLTGVGFAGGLFIVPLNAFLQEHAEREEKGRLLATNNFHNMLGVVVASGTLYLCHELLHWAPAQILIGLGVLTLAATVLIAALIPAPFVRFLTWAVSNLFFKVTVVGAGNIPKEGGALLVVNHASYADAVLIGCASPRLIRFLMWQPLYERAWLQPLCRLFQVIPIPTGAPKESLRALGNARIELQQGSLVCIFPEGELTRTGHVKPFERGVDMVTRGLNSVPVIPIYLDGLWSSAFSMRGGGPRLARLRLRHEVIILIGEPLSGDVSAERLQQRVLELGTEAAEFRKRPTPRRRQSSSPLCAHRQRREEKTAMQIELESALARWTTAGFLDSAQAGLILEHETARAPQRTARVPILIGVALGGIMLAAGVLLFVAAHWIDLSPAQRMAVILFAVGGSHLAAALFADRFHALAVTLHAVGTVALGGAIFLAGQIFNMQEHWPTGILLWALGALAGWWLLREWPQLAVSALLVPFWLVGEWTEAVPHGNDGIPVAAAFCTLLALCYLSIRTPRLEAANSPVARSFAWIGGLAVIPSVFALALSAWDDHQRAPIDPTLDAAGWLAVFLIPLLFAFVYRRTQTWMNLVAAVWVLAFVALPFEHAPAWVFAWCAVGSAGMIAWGIAESRTERVNLGMAGFALTVLGFYFSSVMDKLDRSVSLIVLGVSFLAGAWYWEKLRRKLVSRALLGGLS